MVSEIDSCHPCAANLDSLNLLQMGEVTILDKYVRTKMRKSLALVY